MLSKKVTLDINQNLLLLMTAGANSYANRKGRHAQNA